MRSGKGAFLAVCVLAGVAAGLYASIIQACSPFDGTTAPNDVEGGSGSPDSSTTESSVDPPDLPPDDGDASVIAPGNPVAVDASCPIFPIEVLSATPSPATGTVCNLDGGIEAGALAAGLDLAHGGMNAKINGHTVSSCVGLRFGAPINDVTLRLASVQKACDTICDVCGPDSEYDYADIFLTVFGKPPSEWFFVGATHLTFAFQDFQTLVPPLLDINYVVICRNGGGAGRDDVVLDGVSGHCR